MLWQELTTITPMKNRLWQLNRNMIGTVCFGVSLHTGYSEYSEYSHISCLCMATKVDYSEYVTSQIHHQPEYSEHEEKFVPSVPRATLFTNIELLLVNMSLQSDYSEYSHKFLSLHGQKVDYSDYEFYL